VPHTKNGGIVLQHAVHTTGALDGALQSLADTLWTLLRAKGRVSRPELSEIEKSKNTKIKRNIRYRERRTEMDGEVQRQTGTETPTRKQSHRGSSASSESVITATQTSKSSYIAGEMLDSERRPRLSCSARRVVGAQLPLGVGAGTVVEDLVRSVVSRLLLRRQVQEVLLLLGVDAVHAAAHPDQSASIPRC